MLNFSSIGRRVACTSQPFLFILFLLVLLLGGPGRGWAQAPAWQLAISGTNTQLGSGGYASASAVDANGNVFVTGSFIGTVMFGSTQLVSAGNSDIFVAKWDARAQTFTWATSGGGTGDDEGNGIAVSGMSVFVVGSFASNTNAHIAGQMLAGTGTFYLDVFVAKYVDTSTGSTPTTSSFVNAWVTSGGGTSYDQGNGIAVSGTSVFITGLFDSNANASFAGQALAGTGNGNYEMFVAKYIDTSTGNTTATSSVANGWATSGGGTGNDVGIGIAVHGTGVFVTGFFESSTNASIVGQTLVGAGGADIFVAKYVDTSTGNTPTTSSFANAWVTSNGGTGRDNGSRIVVNNMGIFVTGSFSSGTNAHIAGQALTGIGGTDMFVAKYVDTSTGSTPATSSFANGWATSGGGTFDDGGTGIAMSGTSVFITGAFTSGRNTQIAGQNLVGAGGFDVFVAKYDDTSTGSTPATSSFANIWAISSGGAGDDSSGGIAISGQQISTVGRTTPPATFGSIVFNNNTGGQTIDFLARLTDPTLTPTRPAAPAAALTLAPNPTHLAATLSGTAPHAPVEVLDLLGRAILRATADAEGTAQLALPIGLASGVYLVRSGARVQRLVVE